MAYGDTLLLNIYLKSHLCCLKNSLIAVLAYDHFHSTEILRGELVYIRGKRLGSNVEVAYLQVDAEYIL